MPSSPLVSHVTTSSIHPHIPSPPEGGAPHPSTTTLRRLNFLVLLLRFTTFCFCLASAIFIVSNHSRHPGSPTWHDFGLLRYEVVANGIVALYSLFEMAVATWDIVTGSTILPLPLQLWFDCSHDQVFAYMLLSAMAAGAGEAHDLKRGDTCKLENAFCIQSYVAVALGFVGFVFMAVSAVLSGYRLVVYLVTGCRFHLPV